MIGAQMPGITMKLDGRNLKNHSTTRVRLAIECQTVERAASGQQHWVHPLQPQRELRGMILIRAVIGLLQTEQRRGIQLSAIATTTVGRCSMSAPTAVIGRLLVLRLTRVISLQAVCRLVFMKSILDPVLFAASGSQCVVSENR